MTANRPTQSLGPRCDRREFLKRSGVASLAVSGCTLSDTTITESQAAARRGDRRPNILFIMTDQQHAGMMSCTGNPHLKTPALDRLAASGMRFERAYATNPVCVPSRFSLQTGRMPSAVGMRMNNSRVAVPDEMLTNSIGPLLQGAGYQCAYGGKVHLPGDLSKHIFQHGFEKLTDDPRGELAEQSVAFIKRPREKPFFLFASFMNPHDICYMAINDFARQQGEATRENLDSQICEQTLEEARESPDPAAFVREHCPPLPENFEPPRDEPECITTHYVKARGFRKYAREEWPEETWRLHRWLYARLTERVDALIGRILDAVAEAGLVEETLVIFTSDHGDMDSAHRLEHKSILYEEAARIPFIMSWPGRIPSGKIDQARLLSNGLDLLPTLCDYAEIDSPEGLEGRSVRPLAEEFATPDWRDHVVVESHNGRMVRTGQFKYCIYDCGENREVLIDLAADPGEMNNLARVTEYAEVLNHHRRLLSDWVTRQNDTIARPYLADSDEPA